jgi:hypothetical protein
MPEANDRGSGLFNEENELIAVASYRRLKTPPKPQTNANPQSARLVDTAASGEGLAMASYANIQNPLSAQFIKAALAAYPSSSDNDGMTKKIPSNEPSVPSENAHTTRSP